MGARPQQQEQQQPLGGSPQEPHLTVRLQLAPGEQWPLPPSAPPTTCPQRYAVCLASVKTSHSLPVSRLCTLVPGSLLVVSHALVGPRSAWKSPVAVQSLHTRVALHLLCSSDALDELGGKAHSGDRRCAVAEQCCAVLTQFPQGVLALAIPNLLVCQHS